VRELVARTQAVAYKNAEGDLADLARGERDPAILYTCQQEGGAAGGRAGGVNAGSCRPLRSRPNLAVQRLMQERAEKLRRARARGIRSGMVIYGDGSYSEQETPPEVE